MRGAGLTGAAAAALALAAFGGLAPEPGQDARSSSVKSLTAGGDPVQKSSTPWRNTVQNLLRSAAFTRGAGRSGVGGYIGRGWTVATDRRKARKARNVARNRKAHR